MTRRVEVGVLGATGMVGQQFIALLEGHPWFDLVWLGASERSAGRPYRDAANWKLSTTMPESIADRCVEASAPGKAPRLVFSALDASVAGEIEQAFASSDHVIVSNSRNHRMDATVPLLIPEVNADHLGLLGEQAAQKSWSGAIVTNPNCSTVVMAMVLAPLRAFDLLDVIVVTEQAVSGAGYPGVPSMDILGNVVPFIGGEEEKMETEPKKILGALRDGRVSPHKVCVSAHTTRVPVVDGHTEMLSVRLGDDPEPEAIIDVLARFSGRPQELGLPSAPRQPIVPLAEPDRPQPRLDVYRDRGMSVTVGRVRRCPVLGHKLVALGHNTVRGAAGGAILNAELMVAEGHV